MEFSIDSDYQLIPFGGDLLRFRDINSAPQVEILEPAGWLKPNLGQGGTELVVSADSRHAAVFHYSGLSSQGYQAFQLQPTAIHIGGVPDTYGTGDAPTFSPDGHWLVMFMGGDPKVRDTGQNFEDVYDENSPEIVVVDWAELFFQRLPETVVDHVLIGVEVPLATTPDVVNSWDTYGAVQFPSPDIVALTMPWGEEMHVPLGNRRSHITSRLFTGTTQKDKVAANS